MRVKLGAVDYLSKPWTPTSGGSAARARRPQAEPPENPMSPGPRALEHIQRIYELCGRTVSETGAPAQHAPAPLAAHIGEARAEVGSGDFAAIGARTPLDCFDSATTRLQHHQQTAAD